MDLNKVMIIGRLTRDPELRTTPQGQQVCSFGLATNRSWKDQQTGDKKEQVEFHNLVAWGKLAEIISQYLSKGRRMYAEGRLQTREWQAQDGSKRNRTEIVVENMIMLDSKGEGAANTGSSTQAAPAPSSTQAEEPTVEDIPF
jgi:single-strand DNA-binding protein